MPELEKVRVELESKGIGFIALALDPDPNVVKSRAQQLGVDMTLAVARDEVLGPLGLGGVPATLFVNRDGNIAAIANGARKESFFRERAQALLEAP